MKKITVFIMVVSLSLFLAACGGGKSEHTAGGNEKSKETLTIAHELGETKVEKNPGKVIVFDFGMLDTLDKMNVDVAGVPKASLPPYLSKYEDNKYENVGSLKEPDFEKIAEVGPDLIIISGRQAEMYEELNKIAPTVYLGLDSANYLESFHFNVETLGKIFGQEEFVAGELSKLDEKIASVKEKAASFDEKALILLVNEGKISAYGPGSRFGLIHDILGFKAADPNIEVSTHGQSVSFEYVVEKDPDYIFVVDRTAVVGGDTSAKEVMENELIANTKAYKNGQIIYLDPNYWYLSGGGLVSVEEMISEIENSIK